jgi:hypothetical protein
MRMAVQAIVMPNSFFIFPPYFCTGGGSGFGGFGAFTPPLLWNLSICAL